MSLFRSYATYVRGLDDLEGPIPGLLTLTEDALRFESFEKKSPLAALLPESWRPKHQPVDLTIPRAEILRVTDLTGEERPGPRGSMARLLSWLNVEPNGVRVEWGERTLIFDCERSIEPLLSS